MAHHHVAQQLHRPGSATDPIVLVAGVLTLDLGGVQLAFAAFGAEYRELRCDLVQRARDLLVALAQYRGRLNGIG